MDLTTPFFILNFGKQNIAIDRYRTNMYYSEHIYLLPKENTAAQERKEISNNKDCKALTNYLSCFTFGFVNLGMQDISKKELRKIANFALSVVRS